MDKNINEISILKNIESVPYLAFLPLEQIDFIKHGFSTRLGGVSKGCYSSMNLGLCRGDEEADVMENFRRFCGSVGVVTESLVFTDQTHTTNIRHVTKADLGKGIFLERDYKDIDGLITDEPEIPLVVFGADCVPVYFVDIKRKAIGLSHSGWKGTAGKIAKITIEKMQEEFGTDPCDILAVIGPSIGPECYEVSGDVAESFCREYTALQQKKILTEKENGKYLLNLWQANQYAMMDAGVLADKISISGLCTMCHQDLFFSHRAFGGQRGSMAGILSIARR